VNSLSLVVAQMALGLKLNFQTVIGEAGQSARQQRHLQMLTDLGGKLGMGGPTEDRDFFHCCARV